MLTFLSFTPIESSIGGALIGLSVIAHLLLNGRITGISGTFGGFIQPQKMIRKDPDEWNWRFIYIVGLLFGGWICSSLSFFSVQAFNPQEWAWKNVNSAYDFFTHPLVLSIAAGLFVGFGTQFGNGCTSGHMICGLARLSKRSFLAVGVFCATCLAWVKIANTVGIVAEAYGIPKDEPWVTLPSVATGVTMGVTLLLVMVIYTIFLIWGSKVYEKENGVPSEKHEAFEKVTEKDSREANYQTNESTENSKEIKDQPKQKKENRAVMLFLSFFNALVFALGLGFSGMTKPQKVLGFFDFGGYFYDPSLFCIIVFAILPCLIVFQAYILRRNKQKRPPVFGEKFCLPTKNNLELSLVIGPFIFGCGWGILGNIFQIWK
jgi:uncharacterized membrane protein YedE/YeeE